MPITFAFKATSTQVINHFNNGVALNLCVVVAKSISVNAQTFVLTFHGTDNKFNCENVLSR